MKTIFYFLLLITICSCNQPLQKEESMNEYLIGTWGLKEKVKWKIYGFSMEITQCDLEFSKKRAYWTMNISSNSIGYKSGTVGPIAVKYTIDGKRILLENDPFTQSKSDNFSNVRELICTLQPDSSLLISEALYIPQLEQGITDIRVYKNK